MLAFNDTPVEIIQRELTLHAELTSQHQHEVEQAKFLTKVGLADEDPNDPALLSFVAEMVEHLGYRAHDVDYIDYVDWNWRR